MKNIFLLLACVLLISSCNERNKLPEGFKLISIDGNSYFIHMNEKYIGDKTAQREVGKQVCVDMYDSADYCDVYFWTKLDEIPKKFPIVNRKSMIGLFQMRQGKIKLKALTGNEILNTDESRDEGK